MAYNFDEIYGEEPAQPSTAPAAPPARLADGGYDFDSIYGAEPATATPQAAVQASIYDASFGNPDEAAQRRQVARDLEKFLGDTTPASVIDISDAQRRLRVAEADHATRASPRTSAWLSNAENAAIAADDAKTLAQLEGLTGTLGGMVRGVAKGATYDASAAIAGVALAPLELGEQGLRALGLPEWAAKSHLADVLRDSIRSAQKVGATFNVPGGETTVERGLFSGAQSLGQNLAVLPAGMAARSGELATRIMALMSGGSSYVEARAEGAAPLTALSLAAPDAVAEYATEKFGMKALFDQPAFKSAFLKQAAKFATLEMGGEQVATVWQDFNRWMVLNPEKTLDDFIAERPEAAAQTAIATLVGAGGQVALVRGIDAVFTKESDGAQVEAGAQTLQELFAAAEQSLTRGRDTQTFDAFFQDVAGDATVFVDLVVLRQAAEQAGIDEARLPSLTEQSAEAANVGAGVEIPVAELVSAFTGTGIEQQIIENTRMAPDAATLAEVRADGTKAMEFFQAEAAKALEQATQQEEFRTAAETVRNDVLTEIKAAAPESIAAQQQEGYASLVGSFYSTIASRMGITPLQLRDGWTDAAGVQHRGYRLGVLNEQMRAARMTGQQFDQARNFSEFDRAVQGDLFAKDFATKRTALTRKVVVSSRGATETVKLPNVDSTGRQITATVQGLENFWAFYGTGPVDSKGRPILLYHSTNADIAAFEAGRATVNNFGLLGDVETTRAGIFATPNIKFSQEYLRPGAGQNVMPIYMALQNPIDLREGLTEQDEKALEDAGINTRFIHNVQNQGELFDNDDEGKNTFVDALKALGYDGAIIAEESPGGESKGGDTYVAFDPTQIKSVFNRGTFSRTDPNILLQSANDFLTAFDVADTIELVAPTTSEEEIDRAQDEFLSAFPEGSRYPRDTRLLARIRRASEKALDALDGSPETDREVASTLGPFSAYNVGAEVLEGDSLNPNGSLRVTIFGKEQVEAGLTDEPALTITVTADGELTLNGPSPNTATFEEFKARGWADYARGADGTVQTGWSALKDPANPDKPLPITQILPLLADTHARVREWRGEDYVGLHWTRATGALGGLFDQDESAVFFQEQAKNLVALHNLSAENLKFADDMGGLAVPSIGIVTRERGGVEGFGEITLIGDRRLADPGAEPVFSSDAYTARYPKPEWPKAKSKDAMVLVEMVRAAGKEFDDRGIVDATYDSMVNTPDATQVVSAWLRSDAVQALFLREQGVDIKPVTGKRYFRTYLTAEQLEALRPLYTVVNEQNNNLPIAERDTAEAKELSDKIRGYLHDNLKREGKELSPAAEKNIERIAGQDVNLLYSDYNTLREPVPVDRSATSEQLRTEIDKRAPEFKAWIEGHVLTKFGEPFIKEGRKRVPYTLPNIVAAMTSPKVRGEEKSMTFGAGQARAASSVQFSDVEEMREAAKTAIANTDEYAAAKEETEKLLDAYRTAVVEHTKITDWRGKPDIWEAMDASMRALAKWSTSKVRDTASMRKALQSEDFKVSELPAEALDKAVAAGNALRIAPVPYFEAKPQRAVSLNEFTGALVPAKASAETRAILEKHGIKVREYGEEAARSEEAKAFAEDLGVLFQQAQAQRGAFNPRTLDISFLANADASTFLHETGHFFLTVYADLASQPDAPAEIRADMDALLKWFGVTGQEKGLPGGADLAQAGRDYNERIQVTSKHAPGGVLEIIRNPTRNFALAVAKRSREGALRGIINPVNGDLYIAPATIVDHKTLAEMAGIPFDSVVNDGRVMLRETNIEGYPRGIFAGDKGLLLQGGEVPAPGPLPAGRTPLEVWNSLSLDQQRPYHEQFAESFEQYLFTGKAPTKELQPLFRRFAKWLTSVYGSIRDFVARNKGAKLNEEVSAIFDRMIATDAEIEAMRAARAYTQLFRNAAEAGMNPADFAAYQALDPESLSEAEEQLRTRGLRDMKWLQNRRNKVIAELQEEAKARRAEVRAEVEKEVAERPLYRAMRFLKRGETTAPDGTEIKAEVGHKLRIADVEAIFPTAEGVDLRKLGYGRYGMLAEEGLPPDMVAEIFGFTSGEALVRQLLDAPKFRDEVEGLTDQRMLEQYGDLSSPQDIERAADEAIHNDARTRMVATELHFLGKSIGKPGVLIKAAREYARQIVETKSLKTLKPANFAAEETRAGKAAMEALRKGDREEAARLKRTELLNHAAAKEAYAAAKEMEKIVNRLKKIADTKDEAAARSREMDMVNATRAILAEFGIGRHGAKAAAYLKTVEALDPDMSAALDDIIGEAAANARDYRTLPLRELRELGSMIDAIWSMAKTAKQVQVEGKRLQLDDVRRELTDKLLETAKAPTRPKGLNLTKAETAKVKFARLATQMKRPEAWVGMKDGADTFGPWRRYIWKTINDAQTALTQEKAARLKQMKDLVRPVLQDMVPQRIEAPEIGVTFGASDTLGYSELLHALLHTGNESNKRKLLLGRGWATERADGSLDTSKWDALIARLHSEGKLAKRHWDFVQSVWDFMEDLKPGAQRAHKEAFGRYFDEVTAAPIDTPFGQYKGGYVPARADRLQVADADLKAMTEAGWNSMLKAFPTSRRGFTKGRVEYNVILELNLQSLTRHVDEVLTFTHMNGPVRDVQRILKGGELSSVLAVQDREAINYLILPWLQHAAQQTVTLQGNQNWENWKIWSKLRSRTGAAIMFANLKNVTQQLTSFFPALLKVKPTYLMHAAATNILAPRDLAKHVSAMSPYMNQRINDETYALASEIDEILLNPTKLESAQQWSMKHAYFLQMAVDNWMGPTIWLAKYNETMESAPAGMTEAEIAAHERKAIELADSAVRMTQGAMRPIDVAAFEGGSPFARMFTQFAGFFSTQINLMGEQAVIAQQMPNVKKKYARLGMLAFLGWYAPAIASEIISVLFSGGPPDEDKDGEYLDDWLRQILVAGPVKYATAMVPIAGQGIQAVVNAFNDKPYDDRLGNAPAVGALESAGKAAGAAYKLATDPDYDPKPGPVIRDTGMLLSILTGLPVLPAAKSIGYLADVESGRVSPTSPFDLVRGTITGVASPESKQ